MSIKYVVNKTLEDRATVTYEGTAGTPEEVLDAVAKLAGTTSVGAPLRPEVGDRVLALKDSADNRDSARALLVFYRGETGTVIKVDKYDAELPFQVQWDRGETNWARKDEIVTIYTAPVAAQAPAAAGDALGADPLQGAADWLVEALAKPRPTEIAARLLIGCNRASRLYDAAMQRTSAREG